jgi:hypothetical protein
MKKEDKIYAIIGLIIPWVTLILLIAISTYYCNLLWIRIVCVIVAIINGGVTLRLALNTLHIMKNKKKILV